VASQSFNADSLLQSQTDFLGITTLFTWDAARRLKLAETRAANRPEAQTVQTEWHPTQLNDREKEHLEKMFARVGMEFNR
jgi:YD repeat-containing protein